MLADLWAQTLSTAITVIVLALLAALTRRAPAQFGDLTVLRLPTAMQVVAWVGLLFFTGLLALVIVELVRHPDDVKKLRTAAIGVPLCLGLIVIVLAERRVQLGFDDEGIGGRTAFRGLRRVAWRDLVQVTWSNGGYWFRLRDRDGNVLRVSAWLQGHHLAVDKLCQHVPAVVWQRAVQQWRARTGHRDQAER